MEVSRMEAKIVTLSSKGQVTLPASIRKKLSLTASDKLVAYTSGEYILLKAVKLPSAEEFSRALNEAQAWAREAGYTENDVGSIIKSVRKRNRK
jgi:AbrB family looped-hinge helix DNA binding protein